MNRALTKSMLSIASSLLLIFAISGTVAAQDKRGNVPIGENQRSLAHQSSSKLSHRHRRMPIQLGVRPYFLVEEMEPSRLKRKLQRCMKKRKFRRSDFSIGHRGAPLQFPEHTRESYTAAARQGAGILECDVTFTKDRELVCRHSQCDLHTTTDILARPELASKCTTPFSPADSDNGVAASAKCCTSDLTLMEFKTLCGKMDAADASATTVEEYLGGTADFRTDLYAGCGTVLSHKESIRLFKRLGTGFTPELKSPEVEMPWEGDYTQQDYAQQMIDEYKDARVNPDRVWPQSFNLDDVRFWIENEPDFADQSVYLDSRVYRDPTFSPTLEGMQALIAEGVKVIAPPMFALLDLNANGEIVPSEYAELATEAGLEIITWTLERSGLLKDGGGFYYQSIVDVVDNEGDTFEALHVLAQDVGVIGVFSDWPATTTFYANCMARH